MSADEIRKLADKLPVGVKGGRHGRADETEVVLPDIAMFDRMEIRAALLDYAAMVERCEEKIAEYKSYADAGIVAENISDLNYVLKGATDESKRAEEVPVLRRRSESVPMERPYR